MPVASSYRFPGAGLVTRPPCRSSRPSKDSRTSLQAVNSFLITLHSAQKITQLQGRIPGCHRNSKWISHDAVEIMASLFPQSTPAIY